MSQVKSTFFGRGISKILCFFINCAQLTNIRIYPCHCPFADFALPVFSHLLQPGLKNRPQRFEMVFTEFALLVLSKWLVNELSGHGNNSLEVQFHRMPVQVEDLIY